MPSFAPSVLLSFVAVVGLATIPLACQSGGVGDPCTPEDEYDASFSSFSVLDGRIESRSFQCSTRICLVNHFQGRVSCPLGQSAADIHPCTGESDKSCGAGESCVPSATLAPACTLCAGDPSCVPVLCPLGSQCDPDLGVCTCDANSTATVKFEGVAYGCKALDPACSPSSARCTGLLQSYVCHAPGSCQSASATPAQNQGKACCLPGTDTPVNVPVCGQCDAAGKRDAPSAVYCSCRCGVADGDPPEPDFNFCTCPSGFTCSPFRPDVGLPIDKELNGKYCVKDGTEFQGTSACGFVAGEHDAPCLGVGASH
jgi:hypothetical protein